MSSGHHDHGSIKKHSDSHGHNVHGHDAHDHNSHGHHPHGHDACDDHGSGHDDHGHGGHGHDDHGGGHDDHGHGGHGGAKKPNVVGLAALLGIIILLGIPSLFSRFGGENEGEQQAPQDVPNGQFFASYTVGNARALNSVQIRAFQRSILEISPSRTVPVIYLLTASGQRFMAMDISPLSALGVSNAALPLSKEAYKKALLLEPGYFSLKVTGEPPPEFILAGIAPLVIGITPS
jgi:hypothetical protein